MHYNVFTIAFALSKMKLADADHVHTKGVSFLRRRRFVVVVAVVSNLMRMQSGFLIRVVVVARSLLLSARKEKNRKKKKHPTIGLAACVFFFASSGGASACLNPPHARVGERRYVCYIPTQTKPAATPFGGPPEKPRHNAGPPGTMPAGTHTKTHITQIRDDAMR